MHIPDKYRDRYDRLAASHPWMREMRDEREPSRSEKRAAALDRLNTSGDRDYYRGLIHDLIGEPPADCTHEKVMERLEELLTDEPTNVIDGETNGIHDGITLPEGDAVAILRKAASYDGDYSSSSEALRRLTDSTTVYLALETLADMVERDYVPRYMHDLLDGVMTDKVRLIIAERDELKRKLEIADRHEFESDQACDECKEHTDEHLAEIIAERDELKARISELEKQWDARDSDCIALEAKANRLEDEITDWSELHAQVLSERNHVIAERDIWRTKCDTWEVAYKQADAERKRYSEQIDELFVERDEWKAKAEQAKESYLDAKDARDTWHERYMALEGSSKVRVGQSNLYAIDEHNLRQLYHLGYMDCKQGRYNMPASGLARIECRELSDESRSNDGAVAEHAAHSKAQSKTEPNLTEQSESLSDENDPETPVFVGNPQKTPEQGNEIAANADSDSRENLGSDLGSGSQVGSEVDSRERLEADLKTHLYEFGGYCFSSREGHTDNVDTLFDDFVFLLDRQAAITANETSHDNPYVGLVRGKQWERTEISDYYCGRCGWKVTDHDSYCPECGGALHKASNKPDSKFDARKTAETAENDAAKDDIRDFDDSREKLEADGRKCPGYDPENHYCRYHDADFELTRENVCKLKREVTRLTEHCEHQREELARLNGACTEWREVVREMKQQLPYEQPTKRVREAIAYGDGYIPEQTMKSVSIQLDRVDAQVKKLRDEIIQYGKDCGECGTAMPKGISWPRWSDGSLVEFGQKPRGQRSIGGILFEADHFELLHGVKERWTDWYTLDSDLYGTTYEKQEDEGLA